jgi:hypothetical protein
MAASPSGLAEHADVAQHRPIGERKRLEAIDSLSGDRPLISPTIDYF